MEHHDILETPFVAGTDVIGDVMAQWLDSDEGHRLRQRWLDDVACAAGLAVELELLINAVLNAVRAHTLPPLSPIVSYSLWCSVQRLATYHDIRPTYGWVTDMTTEEES